MFCLTRLDVGVAVYLCWTGGRNGILSRVVSDVVRQGLPSIADC